MPEHQEQIFYNVLPPEKSGGPLKHNGQTIAPIKTTTDSINNNSKISFIYRLLGYIKSHKLPFIIGGSVLAILVIGVIVFIVLKQKNAEAPPPVVESNQDSQNQQIEGVTTPKEWQLKYFGAEICQTVQICGDESDPDRDGLNNKDEEQYKTDPNNPDSSGDGIADGDKVHVFGGDPLKIKTNDDSEYNDVDYIKYGYDLETDQPYTEEKLEQIRQKIKEKGLHQPTIKTLGPEVLAKYGFTDPDQSIDDQIALEGVDLSSSAKLDRDTQRLNTIKKVGNALIKYKRDRGIYPNTDQYGQMIEQVKSYILVATNYDDPINRGKFIYTYIPGNDARDFTLSYFSETQNLLIKYRAADAEAAAVKEDAATYDDQRKRDLESLRIALLLYSSRQIDPQSSVEYAFPPQESYKSAISEYISTIPKDPKTNKDYEYRVNETFDKFTLKAILDNPPAGMTGYQCDQEDCRNY